MARPAAVDAALAPSRNDTTALWCAPQKSQARASRSRRRCVETLRRAASRGSLSPPTCRVRGTQVRAADAGAHEKETSN